MGTVQAIPKPDSYVIEWEALHINGPEDLTTCKRLVKNSPWAVQMVLEESDTVRFLFTTQHGGGGLEQWTLEAGDWVVKSPHGKFWFMGCDEFLDQFTWRAEA